MLVACLPVVAAFLRLVVAGPAFVGLILMGDPLAYVDGADRLVTRAHELLPAGSGDRREPFSLGHEVGGSVPQTPARLSGWTTGAGSGDNQRAMVAQADAGIHQGC
jgi:hypothetical protein